MPGSRSAADSKSSRRVLTTFRAFESDADGQPNPTYRCLFPAPPPDGTVPAHEIADRAGNGETAALACLMRYEDRLARSLASVINLIDPDGLGLIARKPLFIQVARQYHGDLLAHVAG